MPNSQPSRVEAFHSMPAASDTVLVSFTAWGRKAGRHDMFKLLQPLPFAKLFVLDPSHRWYNAGIPGVGETVGEIAAAIGGEIEQLKAARVITIGSSMGGYGAILFGCMLGAERVIALAPQTLVDPSLQPRLLPPDVELEVPDLKPILREASETKVELIAGWDDYTDIFHAQRVAGLDPVRVLAMPGRTHHVALELDSNGELLPLISELIDGRLPNGCLVDPKLDPDVEERFAAGSVAMKRAEWELAAEVMTPVAERYEDWAAPHFPLGKALVSLGDFESAEAAFSRAVASNPRWQALRVELIEVLFELGRLEKAGQVIRDGLALNPTSGPGHLLLARCLLREGRLLEARATARAARDLYADPVNPAVEFLQAMTDENSGMDDPLQRI